MLSSPHSNLWTSTHTLGRSRSSLLIMLISTSRSTFLMNHLCLVRSFKMQQNFHSFLVCSCFFNVEIKTLSGDKAGNVDRRSQKETMVPQLSAAEQECDPAAAPLQLLGKHEKAPNEACMNKMETNYQGDVRLFYFFGAQSGRATVMRWRLCGHPVQFPPQTKYFWNFGLSISSWSPCSFCERLLMFRIAS